MEIKSCEEYVLNELSKKEEELASLKEKYDNLLTRYFNLSMEYGDLVSIFEDYGTLYENENGPWNVIVNLTESSEGETLERLLEIVDMKKLKL